MKAQASPRRGLFALTPERVRFLRFCVVGASGVAVNLGVFALAMYVLLPAMVPAQGALFGHALDLRFLTANFLGILVSILTNFLLNNFWTWGDRRHGQTRLRTRLGRFYLVASVAGAVQMGTAYLVRDLVYAPNELAVLVGIGLATVINYVANNLWTFPQDPSPQDPSPQDPSAT